MTPERFRTLLDAYGAEFRRWPADEREAARSLAQQAPELHALMADSARLDDWLDDHVVTAADTYLVERIATGAPAPARQPRYWLWPGAGLAGIGLAGGLAGAFAVSIALRATGPGLAPDWPERGTAFSELSADWSDE